MDTRGLIIIISGVLLNIITYRVTQKDENKSRRYISLSAGTLMIVMGFYLIIPQELHINEKISLGDIKTKVELFSQRG